jgi:spheroidene monooxygenase
MASPVARTADALPGAAAVAIPGSAAPHSVGPLPAADLSDEVAVMLLADVAAPWRAWGWWRIARGAQALRGTPGLAFAKVLGSGHEGGFGLRPSRSRQGVFAVFASEVHADAFIANAPSVHSYRARSSEMCVLKLRAWSSRGRWSGHTLTPSASPPDAAHGSSMPVVALTRASIHWRHAAAFWRKAPPAQAALAHAPGCLLAAGLGEAPLLRQATFSLWESVAAMDAYARSGAHLDAIRAAAREGYFSESMFVRFVPVSMHGRWKGADYG